MSFLKGFTSLFDWMFPKTYQEMNDTLDDTMQDLYDRHGWGQYQNPLNGYQKSVDINRALESDLEKLIDSYKPGSFIPYFIYDESDDSVTAHFKNGEYVSILLNDNITVFKSFYGGEIIGCRINNLNKVKHETNK